jgi:hypothetical protein
MMGRRDVIGTTLFGALAGGGSPQSAGGDLTEQTGQAMVKALRDVRDAIADPNSFSEIGAIRGKQIDFLRAQNKVPDYVDVGIDVWFGVYDWHIKHRIAPVVARDASGRYTIQVLETTVVLRPDAVAGFVGPAYDAR